MSRIAQKFDHALLKVWFEGSHTSRNFSGVTLMMRSGNVLTIQNSSGATYILNWDHINMIEEIHNE